MLLSPAWIKCGNREDQEGRVDELRREVHARLELDIFGPQRANLIL